MKFDANQVLGSLANIAMALRGDVAGHQVLCPGPGHSPADRSLSVKLDNDAPDGFVVHSFAGDDPIQCRDYVRLKIGVPAWRPRGSLDGASSPSFELPGLGLPRATWQYQDAQGLIVGVVARYGTSAQKEIRPFRLESGRWVMGAMPAPRPLYGLPQLLGSPASAVIVVEGEKAADAARRVFPELSVTTSAGGSQAVRKTDWAGLRGRDVFVWPDHDEPGLKYAADVVDQVRKAGARSVGIVQIPNAWPEKWDLADPLPQGVTAEHLRGLLRSAAAADMPRDADADMGADRDVGQRIKNVALAIALKLVPWDQIQLSTPARDLIKGVLPAGGLAVVYGPPKCGKTFWVFDLVMHVALGWEYRERRTQQGTVVYCLFEGQRAFTARVEAFRQSRLAEHAEGVPFYLVAARLALRDRHTDLIEAIKQQSATKPAIVVLDTLNRSFTGSESSDQDMTAYVAAADAVRDAFDCAVLIVHHSGLEAGRPRGHSSLFGAVDALISVRKESRTIIATVENMKDGAEGATVTSRLRVVEVGVDDDGEAITSCITEPAEAEACDAEPKGGKPLTQGQESMLAILREAGADGLEVEDLNDRARQRGIGVTRRSDHYEIRNQLLTKKLIVYRKGSNRWFARSP